MRPGTPESPPYDAVILAGGRAERFGGGDKPGALVGGRPLVERVAAAVAAAGTIVVVGPFRPGLRAVFTREEPPGGGPIPALRAGLGQVRRDWVALLAADLPFMGAADVTALLRAALAGGTGTDGAGTDEVGAAGAVLVDDGGREQWLAGVWRTAVLRRALEPYEGRSLHGLLGPLAPVRLRPARADGREPWFDCDTVDDLGAARRRAGAP
ncbi:NTP transferase domain-containing protein [Microbispora sp. RL4-1S]|uniref:NTP transferase domain-containing protein n=1 Tax=Microbispora oryzae TaxID=2806554 RepID=A0A940WDM2_9ACTN|nr:NTP transferase domain-containing protein [Microbispora oryzae]MBP2703624.1 NTP transferase domain-containing protein [Microbispora oryzae]